MSEPELLVEELDEATSLLTLNRPQRRNALTIALMQTLCEALDTLAAKPGQRAVILAGSGPGFCSGLDLHEAAETEIAEASADWVARTFQAVADSPLVTVAAVHGATIAGGAGLMASCDFAVAADDLQVCFPEVRRGLVPALVSTVLRDRLRDADLRRLVLTSETIDADRALALGLVDRVVPAAELRSAAVEISAAVLQGAPEAVRQAKRLLRDNRRDDRSGLVEQALESHKQARRGDEAAEGLAAFRERRQPRW